MNSSYVTTSSFLIRLKTVFSNKLHFTYDSLHVKGTLILSIFSKQQSFQTIISQSKIAIFETSE